MKKNNLQVTLSAVAWIFMAIGLISLLSGTFNIFDRHAELYFSASIIVAGVSSICFSLIFFALSHVLLKLDELTMQKQVTKLLDSIPANSEFDEWKKQNPSKSINEYYALKK